MTECCPYGHRPCFQTLNGKLISLAFHCFLSFSLFHHLPSLSTVFRHHTCPKNVQKTLFHKQRLQKVFSSATIARPSSITILPNISLMAAFPWRPCSCNQKGKAEKVSEKKKQEKHNNEQDITFRRPKLRPCCWEWWRKRRSRKHKNLAGLTLVRCFSCFWLLCHL